MNISGFTPEAMEAISQMLHEDFWENKYEGQCGQKQLRERDKTDRTEAQKQADKRRAQNRRGKDNVGSAARSEAAKRAAETRAKCRGQRANRPTQDK
jgi:hypothetical protein